MFEPMSTYVREEGRTKKKEVNMCFLYVESKEKTCIRMYLTNRTCRSLPEMEVELLFVR